MIEEFFQEMADFFGNDVTLASRIAGQAQSGQFLVSLTLKWLTEDAKDIQFVEGQDVGLKGLAGLN